MFVLPLLLVVVTSPTMCFTSAFRVNARMAAREYSEKKDPYGHLRKAIAAGYAVQVDNTKCAKTPTPLAVYLDEGGREPSLMDSALFRGLVKDGRFLYLEARQRGPENGSLGCYSDDGGHTVLIPLGGKVRGSVFAKSCKGQGELVNHMAKRSDIADAIERCPWRKYPVGSLVVARCDGSTKTGSFTCNEQLMWDVKGCDEEPQRTVFVPVTTHVLESDRSYYLRIAKITGIVSGCILLVSGVCSGCRWICKKLTRVVEDSPNSIPMTAP
ncbi:hypothetical protein MRX96_012569 [Rhipicephalus microplus]